jgi:hypothetical protein
LARNLFLCGGVQEVANLKKQIGRERIREGKEGEEERYTLSQKGFPVVVP